MQGNANPDTSLSNGGQDSKVPAVGEGPPNPDRPVDVKSLTLADVEKLLNAGREGDAQARELTRAFYSQPDHPAWAAVGDLAAVALQLIAATVFRDKPAHARTVIEEANKLRATLSGAACHPIVKLAIDRVVLACAFASGGDVLVAGGGAPAITSNKFVKTQEGAEKRIYQAYRSLNMAIKTARGLESMPY